MTIRYGSRFRKRFERLPIEVQEQYRHLEEIFQSDWRDPRLHVKKLVDQEVKLLRSRVEDFMPEDNLDNYENKEEILQAYQEAIKQYPPLKV